MNAARVIEIKQLANDCVDRLDVVGNPGMSGTESLEVVIQVRQIDQAQRRLVFVLDPLRRLGDPARRRVRRPLWRPHSGRGPPKRSERKFTEVFFYLRAQ